MQKNLAWEYKCEQIRTNIGEVQDILSAVHVGYNLALKY
jgi:hypothetical protein